MSDKTWQHYGRTIKFSFLITQTLRSYRLFYPAPATISQLNKLVWNVSFQWIQFCRNRLFPIVGRAKIFAHAKSFLLSTLLFWILTSFTVLRLLSVLTLYTGNELVYRLSRTGPKTDKAQDAREEGTESTVVWIINTSQLPAARSIFARARDEQAAKARKQWDGETASLHCNIAKLGMPCKDIYKRVN